MNFLKTFLRAAVIATSSVVTTAVAASAYTVDAGEEAGPGMTFIETVLWFVVAPAATWLVIWFLWSIPAWRKNARPATGSAWDPTPSNDVVNR